MQYRRGHFGGHGQGVYRLGPRESRLYLYVSTRTNTTPPKKQTLTETPPTKPKPHKTLTRASARRPLALVTGRDELPPGAHGGPLVFFARNFLAPYTPSTPPPIYCRDDCWMDAQRDANGSQVANPQKFVSSASSENPARKSSAPNQRPKPMLAPPTGSPTASRMSRTICTRWASRVGCTLLRGRTPARVSPHRASTRCKTLRSGRAGGSTM